MQYRNLRLPQDTYAQFEQHFSEAMHTVQMPSNRVFEHLGTILSVAKQSHVKLTLSDINSEG